MLGTPPVHTMAISPPVTPRRIPLNITTTDNIEAHSASMQSLTKPSKREREDEVSGTMSDEDDRDSDIDVRPGCGKTFCRICCTEDVSRCARCFVSQVK